MSKRNMIRRALLDGRKLSPATASRAPFHCFSLSQRIGEIKRGYHEWDSRWEYDGLKRVKVRVKVPVEGLPVRTKMRKQGGSVYAVYYLDPEFLENRAETA